MSILILAEHEGELLKPSTLSVLGAGCLLNVPMEIAVIGKSLDRLIEDLSQYKGVERILQFLFSEDQYVSAEQFAAALAPRVGAYTHVLAPSTTFGKHLLPRLAGLLNVGMVSDVSRILDEKTFERPIYAGNAISTVQFQEQVGPILMSVRTTCFETPTLKTSSTKISIETDVIENIMDTAAAFGVEWLDSQEIKSERPALESASIVVSGGRGLQSRENFKLIEDLADKLHAAVGASRAAVDAGFISNDHQVGQTGKVVAPTLYFAIGLSGAIQHVAGMKDSKIIVAINKDPEAPIFEISDYGIVGDLFEIVPKLIEALSE